MDLAHSESSTRPRKKERALPLISPQEEFDRNRKILASNPGRKDRKPGYRVKRRDDGRTGVIVSAAGDGLSVSPHYTVRWDGGETEAFVDPNLLDDAIE